MMFFVIALILVAGVTCLPPPVRRSQRNLPQVINDDALMYETHDHLGRARRTIPADFQHLYVHKDGTVTLTAEDERTTIEIGGSPLTTWKGLQMAAEVVHLMTRHMPGYIFDNIAGSGAGAGVFQWEETMTVYPNFARLKIPPGCGRSCKGSCAQGCTSDGRQWVTVAGIGGIIGAVVENNLLCLNRDPYNHKESILVHEFAHTIKSYALSIKLNTEVNEAYAAAKANATWRLTGYGMRTPQEYWAEASQVFMGVNQLSAWNAADMNACHGNHAPFCNEMEGRQRLKDKDPKLYKVLVEVYTNGKPDLPMGVTICPPH